MDPKHSIIKGLNFTLITGLHNLIFVDMCLSLLLYLTLSEATVEFINQCFQLSKVPSISRGFVFRLVSNMQTVCTLRFIYSPNTSLAEVW